MSESHEHVDLHILEQVEWLLARRDDAPAAPADDEPDRPDLVLVPPLDELATVTSSTHPAGHVPERPLITHAPVTPLPRRR